MNKEIKDNALYVASVDKAFKVLETFQLGSKTLTLTDIIQRTNMGKSAVQRYLFTLENLGYIQKLPQSKSYQLSIKNLTLASGFLFKNPLIQAANPHLVQLRKKLDARIGLSVISNNKIIYLIPLQSSNEAFQNDFPGFDVPIYCTTSGRVFLSRLENSEVYNILNNQNIVSRTPNTKTDINSIIEEIERVRVLGYCVTDQEYLLGQLNLSVPITLENKSIVACIVGVVPASQWSIDKVTTELLPLFQESARQISGMNIPLEN
jgi:IclR family pca regulon transcriptional regulator